MVSWSSSTTLGPATISQMSEAIPERCLLTPHPQDCLQSGRNANEQEAPMSESPDSDWQRESASEQGSSRASGAHFLSPTKDV